MANKDVVATPVNLMGSDPALAPIPVTPVPSPAFPVQAEQYGGDPKVNSVISGAPCQLKTLTGYNSDPNATNLLFVQLHELIAIPIAPGAVPKVVIPVYGGKTPFSLAQALTFSPGLTIGISTTEWTFTAASAFLCWQCTFGRGP